MIDNFCYETCALGRDPSDFGCSGRRKACVSSSSSRCLFLDFCDNAVEGIFQSTPDGHYLFVNRALARMYGYDSPEDLLSSVHDISSDIYADPSKRETFRSEIENSGEVAGLEYQIRRRDGSLLWICEHARAVKNEKGAVIRYEGSIHDISARKDAEEAHMHLEAQLRQSHKMEAIGTLAGGIAHDFNNLLAVIQGFTQLAMEDRELNSRSRGYLNESLKATHRAADIVKQILSFSRKTEVERVHLKLRTIVREIISLIRAGLPSNVECRSDFDVQEDWVLVNPTQLHQVLLNLCTNAGYAMRRNGGELRVRVGMFEGVLPPELTASSYLSLSVADTGEGVESSVMERIFDPFFTTKPKGEGTGLGLAVAMGIVRGHGGTIMVESELGKGTVFNVLLPLAAAQEEPQIIQGEIVPMRGSARILCVDDEDGVLAMLQHHLRNHGYRVITRADGAEALRCFLQSPEAFDLLLTDYTMPGLLGTELSVEIKRARPDLPVILCSGQMDVLSISEIRKLGISSIVPKPIELPGLFLAIENALQVQSAVRCA